jgi:serine/threonine-protein kinase
MAHSNHIVLVENIGSGGTARIYKAVDTNTGFPVAVKVLWTNLFKNESMKERFLKEANHYLYLVHPNIIQLKDFIQKDDASYLVMEYVEGQNLEEYITNFSGPIPEAQAIRIIKDVLSGIQYAHEQDVLHLDIKPSNIMITKAGEIKIIDFGISTGFMEANKGTVMGSPLYMSPEQTEGYDIDNRTDIYSLGITFFQMLTGTTPIKGNISRDELFAQKRAGDLPKAKSFYPFVSDYIQEIIDKATMVDKNKRFQSADEFSKALN